MTEEHFNMSSNMSFEVTKPKLESLLSVFNLLLEQHKISSKGKFGRPLYLTCEEETELVKRIKEHYGFAFPEEKLAFLTKLLLQHSDLVTSVFSDCILASPVISTTKPARVKLVLDDAILSSQQYFGIEGIRRLTFPMLKVESIHFLAANKNTLGIFFDNSEVLCSVENLNLSNNRSDLNVTTKLCPMSERFASASLEQSKFRSVKYSWILSSLIENNSLTLTTFRENLKNLAAIENPISIHIKHVADLYYSGKSKIASYLLYEAPFDTKAVCKSSNIEDSADIDIVEDFFETGENLKLEEALLVGIETYADYRGLTSSTKKSTSFCL